jgi:hypothetical protein
MDVHALRHWLVTVDNLMTNDKTSFKELLGIFCKSTMKLSLILAKINTSTPTALSTLMTSREVEYEIRASHMKRLAYVILSSEVGQYSEQLSEILERINENLRISQAPIIHAQVFACYRILLIRMMPSSFETIWPSLYTEMVCHKSQSSMLRYTLTVKVQVLGHMEQQLSSSSGNLKEDHWMQLYLSASKLLETLCILPSGHVTQFQLLVS